MSLEDGPCESQEEQSRRQSSIWDANDFIESFVKDGWEDYWSSIKIVCDLTLEELHEIGHLPRSQGTSECRKLVRVPVINDTIGTALWELLATMARGDEDGNIDDTEVIRAWEHSVARERMRQEINAMKYRQKSRRRSASPPPSSPKQGCVFCPPSHRHIGVCTLSKAQHQLPSPEIDPLMPEAPPRKLSWIFPARRRSSAAARSCHSPKLQQPPLPNDQWEQGFWQQQGHQQERNELPSSLLKANSPVPEETAEEVSAPPSFKSPKSSFPKRMLRKLSGPQLLSNMSEFGESLGVGYGSREAGPIISSAMSVTDQPY